MALLPTLIFLLLFAPAVATACLAVAEARREPGRDRPMMLDEAGGGGGNCGGGSCDGGGGS